MSPKEAVDSELIEKLGARDPDAIAMAYDRYGRIAYSLFVRVTRDQSVSPRI